jgi:hypothetical protein
MIQPKSGEIHSGRSIAMVANQDLTMETVELWAREENQPPKGIEPQPDRDIGFASVLLRLNNPHQVTISITVQEVEIRNVSDHQLQPFHHPPQDILLGPLENGAFAFYLTNKTGFEGDDQVEAVVTYEIGGETRVIVSEPVEVDR